ncbi:RNA polymerase sigma-70 factor, ECF subfamily [Marinospirillum celere]|uniref:RNA polymerase sigma-70 factor, ECF subfamily n=1 Tax=Marinospirillum celere TaxID=1122252 RepID=A0A1I1HUC5_9GAMM|nr:RNA polymerase sigma factor [Marinospirillum celere]SFC27471.1 RNA polymerase sigma-70 factor, ECF subfamily [Marinospirillum celere]
MSKLTSLAAWIRPSDSQKKADFQARLRPHSRALYQTAFRLTGNQADAEDLTQELFLRLYQKWDHWHHLDNPLPWFLRTLTNLHIDTYRKIRHTHGANELTSNFDHLPFQVPALDSASPLALALANSRKCLLNQALNSLEAEHRSLVVLHLMEGYSLQEVAEIQHLPLGTLKSRLHRCKDKLKKILLREPFQENLRFNRVSSQED